MFTLSLGQFSFTHSKPHRNYLFLINSTALDLNFISHSVSYANKFWWNSWTRQIVCARMCVILTLLSAFYWASPIQNYSFFSFVLCSSHSFSSHWFLAHFLCDMIEDMLCVVGLSTLTFLFRTHSYDDDDDVCMFLPSCYHHHKLVMRLHTFLNHVCACVSMCLCIWMYCLIIAYYRW